MMADRIARRGFVAVIAVLLSIALIPAATAQADHLEVSHDGITWSRSLPEALFASDIVLVPGQSVSTELHLRSAAPSAGVLALALENVDASDERAAHAFGLQVDVTEGGGGGLLPGGVQRTRFAELVEGAPLGAPLRIEPGQEVVLALTIDLEDRAADNRAQNSAIGLDLRVTFIDAVAFGETTPSPETSADHGSQKGPQHVIPVLGAVASPTSAGQHPASLHGGEEARAEQSTTLNNGRGFLAVTGNSAQGLFIAGVIILLVGAALLVHSRRRPQEKP